MGVREPIREEVRSMYLSKHGAEIYEKLLEKARELGRPPTFEEVASDERLPHPNDYAYYFGSFGDAAEKVGKELRAADPNRAGPVIKRFAPIDPKVRAEQEKMVEGYRNIKRFFEDQERKAREKAQRQAEVSKKARELGKKIAGGRKAKAELEARDKAELEARDKAIGKEQSIEPIGGQDTEIKEGIGMDSAKETVTREELLQELISLTGEHQRFMRFARTDNDLALLKHDKQLYIDLVGGGSVAGIRKAILDETGWVFETHTNTVKPRIRVASKKAQGPKLERGPKLEEKPKASKKAGGASVASREVTEEKISEVMNQMGVAEAQEDSKEAQEAGKTSDGVGADILKMPQIRSYDKNYGKGFLKKDTIPNFTEVSETKMKTKAFAICVKTDADGREQLEIVFNASDTSFERMTYDDDTCSVKILC